MPPTMLMRKKRNGGYQYDAVPEYAIDYTKSVDAWWEGHPLNPIRYRGRSIAHPEPHLYAANYASLQAAIDALPATGGTIFLAANTVETAYEYSEVVAKSNVHFVGQGEGVTYCEEIQIFSDELTRDYTTFQVALDGGSAAELLVANNRKSNFYFGDITFDGTNTTPDWDENHHTTGYAIFLRTVKDVVIEHCTFQNYDDLFEWHPGLVSGNALVDNIWALNCTFSGTARYAFFLDGAHGCGVVNSTLANAFGSGGILGLTNTDYTVDIDGSGTYSRSEHRNGQYWVIDGVTTSSVSTFVQMTAGPVLVQNCTSVTNSPKFVHLLAKCSRLAASDGVIYDNQGSIIRNNTINNCVQVLYIDGDTGDDNCSGSEFAAITGQYQVLNNTLAAAVSYVAVVTEVAPVTSPNVVSGNTRNGSPVP
jgi:hypothetical protein